MYVGVILGMVANVIQLGSIPHVRGGDPVKK